LLLDCSSGKKKDHLLFALDRFGPRKLISFRCIREQC
jgi:hypothetical protein